MNLTTLTSFCAQFAMDKDQTRYAGLYTTYLNESQLQFALDTRCLFKDQAYSIVSGTATYALPADFMFEKKVTRSTVNNTSGGIQLYPVSRATLEFYKKDSDWTQVNGTPVAFMIDPEEARKQIRLYPNPAGADAGTNNLLLTYHPDPAALVNPTDIPLNAYLLLVQFHIAIAAWAAILLLMGEPVSETMQAKISFLTKFYRDAVTQCIDRFGNTASEPLQLRGGREWR